MILNIVDIKDPRLRKKSKPVTKIDKKIKKLIADMKETLTAQADPEGVGLAAPQVGKNLRLFIANYEDMKNKVFINPKITKIFKTRTKKKKKRKDGELLEGCLSLPHYYGPLERAEKVEVQYTDEDGKTHQEIFENFHAHIMQHEVDHLNGVVFVDHILEQGANLYKLEGDDWYEVDLI